jgi:hypothetical protein
VLMYLDDIRPMLAGLARVAAPDGAISLLVRNGLAPAMRDGLRGRWPQAMRAFGSKDYVNRLGLAAHAHTPQDVDRALEPLGWRRSAWYGVRVFTDHRDEPAPQGGDIADLLAAEREAGGREPYRSVAALLHLIYVRGRASQHGSRGTSAGSAATAASLRDDRPGRSAECDSDFMVLDCRGNGTWRAAESRVLWLLTI